MVRRIQIKASGYGMPGRVVAVENGQVVWAGRIENLGEAGSFDALFCRDDDEERLIGLLSRIVDAPTPSLDDPNASNDE